MKESEDGKASWVLYILECADGTFYTGITTDLSRRVNEHESGAGAKYTRGRGPFKVIYTEFHANRSDASKREIKIKSLGRMLKQQLCLIN